MGSSELGDINTLLLLFYILFGVNKSQGKSTKTNNASVKPFQPSLLSAHFIQLKILISKGVTNILLFHS